MTTPNKLWLTQYSNMTKRLWKQSSAGPRLSKSLFRWVMSLSALRRCHATSRGTAIHNVRGGKSAIMHDLTGYDPMLYHLLSLLVIYNPHGPRQITPTSLTDRVKFPYMDSLDIFKCEWHMEFGTFSFKISIFFTPLHKKLHCKTVFKFMNKGRKVTAQPNFLIHSRECERW